jgi:hypothetical protein
LSCEDSIITKTACCSRVRVMEDMDAKQCFEAFILPGKP